MRRNKQHREENYAIADEETGGKEIDRERLDLETEHRGLEDGRHSGGGWKNNNH